MEILNQEIRGTISKTAQEFLVKMAEEASKAIIDAHVPGTGRALDVAMRTVEAKRAIRAVTESEGEVGVPICPLGDIELMVDVRVGGSGELPLVGFAAPGGEDGLLGGLEIEPLDDERKDRDSKTRDTTAVALRQDDGPTRAVIMDIDLSPIAQETTPHTRAAIMRDWAEQEIQPHLHGQKRMEDVELVIMYDRTRGIGAWLILRRKKNKWRIALRWDSERHAFAIEIFGVTARA